MTHGCSAKDVHRQPQEDRLRARKWSGFFLQDPYLCRLGLYLLSVLGLMWPAFHFSMSTHFTPPAHLAAGFPGIIFLDPNIGQDRSLLYDLRYVST